jgi:hypothetical protein
MMRKDGVGLSNEAWARRLAYLKHPGMLARNMQHNQRDLSLLQDQDVPDLTESLTKTLVHGNDRKGDTHGNETLDSLEEIDEDDLALFLPDVASSSDSETGTFPHNYVDIIGDQFDQMESLDAITNIASSCTPGVATCASASGPGNEEIARAFQQHVGTSQKQAILPDTTNSDLLPLESNVRTKSSVSETITRPEQQSDQGSNINHPSDISQLEDLSSQPSQSCETQLSQSCGSVISPGSDDHDNNNHCTSTASGSPCCDTLSFTQADSHCYLDTGPGSSCHQQPHDHDLPNLDSVSNVSPDSGILSISESPESQEAASPCNPIATHHPTLSPQSVFLDSVSPPRHLDYLQPEADSTEDNPGYHSDVNDEPPPLIPMYDHNVLSTQAKKRGRGRPRKNPLKSEKAIISPTKLDQSFDSSISEEPPDISGERMVEHGLIQFKEIRVETPPSKPKNIAKPDCESVPKKRGPGRPKGSGERSQKKIKDLLLLSAIEREQALGNKVVNVSDLSQFTKTKGRKKKSETVKALFAMVEEARKSQKVIAKKSVVGLEKGYAMSEANCDEDSQVKKKVRKPVSSKVLASGLKAADSSKVLPKVQKVAKVSKGPRKSISAIMDELKSGDLIASVDDCMDKSLESVGTVVIQSSKDELNELTSVKQKYNANVIAESYRVVSSKGFMSEKKHTVVSRRKVKDLVCDSKLSENVPEKLTDMNARPGLSVVTDKLLSAKQKDSSKVTKSRNKSISLTRSSKPSLSTDLDKPVKKKRGPGRPRKSPIQPADKVVTPKVNKVLHPKGGKEVTSKVDKIVTRKLDKLVTSKVDKVVTLKVYKVVTPKVDKIVISKADKLVSLKGDKVVSQKVDKVVSPKADRVVSPKVDKVVSPKVDKAVSPKLDKVVTSKADKLVSLKEDKVVSQKVCKVVSHKADKVVSSKADKVVSPKVDKVVSPKMNKVVSPKMNKVVTRKADKVVSPKADKVASSKVGKVMSPKVVSPKLNKVTSPKARSEGPLSDSSRRSGEDFASLIQSVQASIDSQFKGHIDDSEDLHDISLGNSLDKIEPSLSSSPKAKQSKLPPKQKQNKQLVSGTKPKVKKPKVHVMMRRTKRRRRKKKVEKPDVSETLSVETDLGSAGTVEYETCQDNSVGLLMVVPSTSCSTAASTPPASPSPVLPSAGSGEKKKEEPAKPAPEATFGAGSQFLNEKTEELSKTLLQSPSTSAPPAPKLNLPPPCEKPHSKVVKKKKLKPFKSKHKNIIDPVFLEDVDEMSDQLEKLVLDLECAISIPRNVKPGEDPMPDIFRKQTYVGRKRKKEWLSIHKQQNKELRKVKERDKKVDKPKEKSGEPEEHVAPPVAASPALVTVDKLGKGKGKKVDGRKRKCSISESEVVVHKPVSLSPLPEYVKHNDHCLPLKKRHKVFTAASEGQKNVEELTVKPSPPVPPPEPAPLPLPPTPVVLPQLQKRKPGRPRKNQMVEDKHKTGKTCDIFWY